MAITNVTMNLDALQNMTAPTINISTDGSLIFGQMIEQANRYTNDWLLMGILIGLTILTYFVFADRTPFGDFQYDDARALCLSLGMATLIGVTLVEVGWSPNFKTVGFFTILFLLDWIFILIYENKE